MTESAALPLIYSCDDHLDIYHLPADLWTSGSAKSCGLPMKGSAG